MRYAIDVGGIACELSNEHSHASDGIPVLVLPNGEALGHGDIMAVGEGHPVLALLRETAGEAVRCALYRLHERPEPASEAWSDCDSPMGCKAINLRREGLRMDADGWEHSPLCQWLHSFIIGEEVARDRS